MEKILEALYQSLESTDLETLSPLLQKGIEQRLSAYTHGFLPQWIERIHNLPVFPDSQVDICQSVSVQSPESKDRIEDIKAELLALKPWRKGPYHIHGVHIDTEWRSDWKWDRLQSHITPLKGRQVLDIGCGNGYHCWRMLGAGAEMVLGIDPSQLFWMQFLCIKHFLGQQHKAYFAPIGIEHLPQHYPHFDSVFSMGVLYHRKSPIEHLSHIKRLLKPGGELILETLVVDGDATTVFVPEDRYACMANVWFLPSVEALSLWLLKLGYSNIRCVDISTTTVEEQRQTEWMDYHSLPNFLNPSQNQTIEGHPPPKRAVILANNGVTG